MGARLFGFTCGVALAAGLCVGCGSSSLTSISSRTSVSHSTTSTHSSSSRTTRGIGRRSRRATAGLSLSRYVRCDANIEARIATTTCAFALNTFYEFYAHGQQPTVRVWSPAAARFFSTHCAAGQVISCVATDGGRVRFRLAAVRATTTAWLARSQRLTILDPCLLWTLLLRVHSRRRRRRASRARPWGVPIPARSHASATRASTCRLSRSRRQRFRRPRYRPLTLAVRITRRSTSLRSTFRR